MNCENPSKIYVVGNKIVSMLSGSWRVMKKKGGKYEGNLHYVIENKWRKNVRFSPFHDVDENKRVKPFFPRC
jgi:hypothetical protein